MLLVGGSIAFAGQALDRRGRQAAAAPTAPPPPAVTLLAPEQAITRLDRVDISALRPLGLRQDQRYVARIYVNGANVGERELPRDDQFLFEDVPLDRGANDIRVALIGSGAEGQLSAAVAVTRDDKSPEIAVSRPASDDVVYAETATLAGSTEPGATLSVTDVTSRDEVDVALRSDGSFVAEVTLELGDNRFLLRSTDLAGNESSTRVVVPRATSAAALSLAVSPNKLVTADLPTRVEMHSVVRDELGRLVDGATVTFSVSPPDRETTTYRATTAKGRARLSDLVIDPGDSRGVWLVTALATLPSGLELRQDSSFSLE